MKKFLKKNWIRLSIIGLSIVSIVVGWLKYGKAIMDFLSLGTDLDALDSERRADQRRTDAGFERIDDTIGRAEGLEREASERDKRVSEQSGKVSESGEQLSRTNERVSDLNQRIEDRIQRNKDLLQRL